jgi:hypothetical protein
MTTSKKTTQTTPVPATKAAKLSDNRAALIAAIGKLPEATCANTLDCVEYVLANMMKSGDGLVLDYRGAGSDESMEHVFQVLSVFEGQLASAAQKAMKTVHDEVVTKARAMGFPG